MEVRIPTEKLHDIRQKLVEMSVTPKTTLRDMQSLIGSLNFACRAIRPGRPFCRRLMDATKGKASMKHHYLRVTKGIRDDIKSWLRFMSEHNGVSIMYDKLW